MNVLRLTIFLFFLPICSLVGQSPAATNKIGAEQFPVGSVQVMEKNASSFAVLLGIAVVVFAIPFIAKRRLAISDAELAELWGGGSKAPQKGEDPESA